MEASIRVKAGGERPWSTCSQSTRKAGVASAECSRQGVKEMRSEIVIRNLIVQNSAEPVKEDGFSSESNRSHQEVLSRRIMSGLYFQLALASVILTQLLMISFTCWVFFFFFPSFHPSHMPLLTLLQIYGLCFH